MMHGCIMALFLSSLRLISVLARSLGLCSRLEKRFLPRRASFCDLFGVCLCVEVHAFPLSVARQRRHCRDEIA